MGFLPRAPTEALQVSMRVGYLASFTHRCHLLSRIIKTGTTNRSTTRGDTSSSTMLNSSLQTGHFQLSH